MDLTKKNYNKYMKMSKNILVTDIVGICMHLIMSKNMLDDWLNKKQILIDLHRILRREYKKNKKQELELIIFDEDLIICDIKYTLDKKVDNKIYIPHDSDDENSGDEVPPDSDVDTSDSGEEALESLPTIAPLIKSLSQHHVATKQKKYKKSK